MNDTSRNDVGRRLREIRTWRRQNLKVTADLAGISYGYLGRIERGEQALTNRATLEALARALRVSPTEFSPSAWQTSSPDDSNETAHAGLVEIERTLDIYELGQDPECPVRDWHSIAADVANLADLIQRADYAAQTQLVTKLIPELCAIHARSDERRTEALHGLIICYSSAMYTSKRLGSRGLPLLAAKTAQQCAAELESPAWTGYTAWLRGDATGGLSRPEQYRRAVATIDHLSPHLNDTNALQAAGMLHLSASLAAAVQADRTTAETHLEEASDLAARMDTETGSFGNMHFGAPNIGVWRATIGLELGDGVKVAERARSVNIRSIVSPTRHAEFYMEVGRSLLTERNHREEGIKVLLRAEHLAPQRVHNDILAREAVADALRAARRDAGGRELRGLAWRIGIAPDTSPHN